MDSINLSESPLLAINRYAKIRIASLIMIVIIGILGISVTLMVLHEINSAQKNKINLLMPSASDFNHWTIKNAQVQKSQCAAKIIQALPSVRGISIEGLSFEKDFEIRGKYKNPKGLEAFKISVDPFFNSPILNKEHHDFNLRGAIKC